MLLEVLPAKPAASGIFPVRPPLGPCLRADTCRSVWVIDGSTNASSGDKETPTCARCRATGRPCTRNFSVRFSKRRAWAPPPVSPVSPNASQPRSLTPRRAVPDNSLENPEPLPQTERPDQPRSTPESQSCPLGTPLKNPDSSPNSSGTPGLSETTERESQQIVHLLSSPITLSTEDASLLQYFGEYIGRPW